MPPYNYPTAGSRDRDSLRGMPVFAADVCTPNLGLNAALSRAEHLANNLEGVAIRAQKLVTLWVADKEGETGGPLPAEPPGLLGVLHVQLDRIERAMAAVESKLTRLETL